MRKVYKNEQGYIQSIKHIIDNGVDIPSRSGDCRAVFGMNIQYDNDCLSTVRMASLRLAFCELMFFLRGQTNTKILEDKGVYFWQPQTSRGFLDSRGLHYLNEGELGSAYSTQWRNFGGYDVEESKRTGVSCAHGGKDQLKELIETMGNDRYSRRMLVNLWNPLEAEHGVLTPCWFASQWIVLPDKDGVDTLHCKMFNRSNDSIFGGTFAYQQYNLLKIFLSNMFDFKEGLVDASVSHAHIYHNQLEYANELIDRELGVQGKVSLNKKLTSLDDLLSLEWDDIVVTGLEVNKKPFKAVKPPMAV